MMILALAIAILCSPGLVACKTIADSVQDGDAGGLPPWKSTHQTASCDPGYFDLNAVSSLKFYDRDPMRTPSGFQNLLQCGSCDENGTPALVSCISSVASRHLRDRSWRCKGGIDNQYSGMDDMEIECERQEGKTSPHLDCMKYDSCVLRSSVQKRSRRDADFPAAHGPPWWIFLIPVAMLLCMCGICGFCCYYGHVYQSRLLRAIPDQVVTIESCEFRAVPAVSTAPPPYSPTAYEATMGKDPPQASAPDLDLKA